MSLKEKVYSVMIVSSSESFNNALSALLPESKYSPVNFAANISSAKRAILERSYDYIIVNSPLPDDTGIRFSIDACNSNRTVVLFLVRSELRAEIHNDVAEHGVFTLPKPISKSSMAMALDWMASARERLRRNEKKALSVEEKMKEIRIVNRAKWLLISELKMSEPDAHRYIEKQAMDQCCTKKDIAENIIKTYS